MIKKTISQNIKYNAVSQAVVFAINFLLFPFIVSHVGKEMYGAYLLVMTFTGYLGVFDFGVGTALIKYVAEFTGKKDYDQANKVINTSLTFYFVIGVLSFLVLLVLSFVFHYLFNTDAVHQLFIQRLFWIAAAASLFVWVGRTFDSVLQGFQRYGTISFVNTITSVLTAASAYLIFTNGMGMGWFLAVSYIFIVIKYFIFYVVSGRYAAHIKIVFPYLNKEMFAKIFSFSVFLFFSNVVGLVIFNIDNFIIGAFLSVSAITLYGVGYMFQQGLRTINSFIGTPLFPAGADMEGRNEEGKQKNLFLKGTKYMTLFFAPIVIITICFAPPFIRHWMGPGFEEGILPAQILMFFWIFNNAVEVGSGLLVVKGYVRERFKFDVINAILNLSLSIILARRLGIIGVALGTAIPMVLVYFPLVLSLALKVLKVRFSEFFTLVVAKNLLVYLFSVFVSLLVIYVYSPHTLSLTVIEMAGVYAIVAAIGFRFALLPGERRELLSMIK